MDLLHLGIALLAATSSFVGAASSTTCASDDANATVVSQLHCFVAHPTSGTVVDAYFKCPGEVEVHANGTIFGQQLNHEFSVANPTLSDVNIQSEMMTVAGSVTVTFQYVPADHRYHVVARLYVLGSVMSTILDAHFDLTGLVCNAIPLITTRPSSAVAVDVSPSTSMGRTESVSATVDPGANPGQQQGNSTAIRTIGHSSSLLLLLLPLLVSTAAVFVSLAK